MTLLAIISSSIPLPRGEGKYCTRGEEVTELSITVGDLLTDEQPGRQQSG